MFFHIYLYYLSYILFFSTVVLSLKLNGKIIFNRSLLSNWYSPSPIPSNLIDIQSLNKQINVSVNYDVVYEVDIVKSKLVRLLEPESISEDENLQNFINNAIFVKIDSLPYVSLKKRSDEVLFWNNLQTDVIDVKSLHFHKFISKFSFDDLESIGIYVKKLSFSSTMIKN